MRLRESDLDRHHREAVVQLLILFVFFVCPLRKDRDNHRVGGLPRAPVGVGESAGISRGDEVERSLGWRQTVVIGNRLVAGVEETFDTVGAGAFHGATVVCVTKEVGRGCVPHPVKRVTMTRLLSGIQEIRIEIASPSDNDRLGNIGGAGRPDDVGCLLNG